jgi:hypothetical protein
MQAFDKRCGSCWKSSPAIEGSTFGSRPLFGVHGRRGPGFGKEQRQLAMERYFASHAMDIMAPIEAMLRRRLIIYIATSLLLITLVLVGGFIVVCTLAPSVSAKSSCHIMMALKPGYGPWKVQPSASPASLVYSDGVNTASCHAKQYGPIWIVVGLEQTMIGCGRGLSTGGGQECPRGLYGVIP